jgi:hypothetical protein
VLKFNTMTPQHLKINIQDEISADKLKLAYNKQRSDRARYEQENSISKSTGQAFQKYYVETKVYYTTANIGSECNEITFINNGTTALVIADVPLQPNQSLRISGNRGEIDTTQYQLAFATPINTGNQLIVIRKLYI